MRVLLLNDGGYDLESSSGFPLRVDDERIYLTKNASGSTLVMIPPEVLVEHGFEDAEGEDYPFYLDDEAEVLIK